MIKQYINDCLIDWPAWEGLTKMQQGRVIKVLQGKTRYSLHGKSVSLPGLLNTSGFQKITEEYMHPFIWSRTKYNRLSFQAQIDYENKYKQKVPKYCLYISECIYHFIPKVIYDILIKPKEALCVKEKKT
jgi:hypothetical protein